MRGSVMDNEQDCEMVVCEFELQSRCYVHFRTYTLGKGMSSDIPPKHGLNSTTTVLLKRLASAGNNPRSLI